MISNILGGRKMIPVVEKMEVFPVAGHDCMELNLSGAHAPYFTRNIVILTDSNGVERCWRSSGRRSPAIWSSIRYARE